ncbi:MAG: hypothetical protein C0599_05890 [Salinivirgaceae bacterium]|nr:MAG: hypothetical protein C0599_05890 [Salinivirgaceae bacterium]
MILMRKLHWILILVVFVLGIKSCSIEYTFTGASIPIEAKTFTVRDIDNIAPTINPSLASDLQLALSDKLLTQTRLSSIPYDGDLIYDITITGYEVKPTSISGGDESVAVENRLTVRVKVKYMNRYDQEAEFEKSFSQFADYESDQNLLDVEDGLVETIIENLINDIFNASVANW